MSDWSSDVCASDLFRVPELVLSSLRVGQPIRVIVDALPNRTFEGEIYVIDPIVDENGRAVRLRARIPNPDRSLKPGLFARVQIDAERRDNAVLEIGRASCRERVCQYVSISVVAVS